MELTELQKQALNMMRGWERTDLVEQMEEFLPHIDPTFLQEWLTRQRKGN